MRAEARARTLAGVLVLLLAALVAATYDGSAWPGRPTIGQHATEQPADQPGSTPGHTRGLRPPQPGTPPTLPRWVRTAVLGAIAVLAAGAALSVLLSLRLALLRRRLKGTARLRADAVGPPPAEAEPDAEAVAVALADTLAGLDEGSPRNAVVACWIRLEDLAAARGLPREPADTPAEFVVRALAAYRLDEAALGRLADLYREARFSRHPLGERHRDEARACLRDLAAGVAA